LRLDSAFPAEGPSDGYDTALVQKYTFLGFPFFSGIVLGTHWSSWTSAKNWSKKIKHDHWIHTKMTEERQAGLNLSSNQLHHIWMVKSFMGERRCQVPLQSFGPQPKHSIISNRSSSQTLPIWICSRMLMSLFHHLLTHPGRRGDQLLFQFFFNANYLGLSWAQLNSDTLISVCWGNRNNLLTSLILETF